MIVTKKITPIFTKEEERRYMAIYKGYLSSNLLKDSALRERYSEWINTRLNSLMTKGVLHGKQEPYHKDEMSYSEMPSYLYDEVRKEGNFKTKTSCMRRANH